MGKARPKDNSLAPVLRGKGRGEGRRSKGRSCFSAVAKRFVLVLACLHLGAAEAADARQWTDRSGSYSVEAELVKVEDGRCT